MNDVVPAIPQAVIMAVLEVREKVPALAKDTVNPFAKYNYAPIDAYYERIKPVATAAGLGWRARELSYTHIPEGKGSYRGSYSFDLFVKTGEVSMDYMSVTIVGHDQGAQTTGQLFSYAEKVFMRAAFGVETGEADADAQDNRPSSPSRDGGPKTGFIGGGGVAMRGGGGSIGTLQNSTTNVVSINQPAAQVDDFPVTDQVGQQAIKSSQDKDGNPVFVTKNVTQDQAQLLYMALATWVTEPKTLSKLRNYWAVNTPAIELLKQYDATLYDKLLVEFTKARDAFAN